MPDPVFFYGPRNTWGEFSNFYPCQFVLDEQVWVTSEHYYMGQKTTDLTERERIRKASSAREAKAMGRKVRLRAGWDGMKFSIMEKAAYAKFDQNTPLREVLFDTGDRPIHENCRDPWWGGGPNFPNGRDWLGKVLLRVRERLAERYRSEFEAAQQGQKWEAEWVTKVLTD